MKALVTSFRGILPLGALLVLYCALFPANSATAQGLKVGLDHNRPDKLKTERNRRYYKQLTPAGIRKVTKSLRAICPCLLIYAVPAGKNKGTVYVRDPRNKEGMAKDEKKAFSNKLVDKKANDLCDCYKKHRVGCNLVWELSRSSQSVNLWRSETREGVNSGESRHLRGNVAWNYRNTLAAPVRYQNKIRRLPHVPIEVMLAHELSHAYMWKKGGYKYKPQTEAEEIDAAHAENQVRAELVQAELRKRNSHKVRIIRLSPRAIYDYDGKELEITGTKDVISKDDLLKCDEKKKKVALLSPEGEPNEGISTPETYAIATQIPEVCVGTTYTVTEGAILEEELPLVTEDDGEDLRDVPQEGVPVVSVPDDSDEPRDVPKEDVAVVSVPEDSDEPRDVPQEGVPVVSVPDDEGNPTDTPQEDVPVVSTPRETDELTDEEIDLGLVKAQEVIVELALVDRADGEPISNVAVKILAEEPPLPGDDTTDVAFDSESFFEEDVEGGYSGEDGSVQLASLTSPASVPKDAGATGPPERSTDDAKNRSSAEIQKDIDALRKKYLDAFSRQEDVLKGLRKDDPEYKSAEETSDKERDSAIKKAKTAAEKKRQEIEGFQGVGKAAKKGMQDQVDKDIEEEQRQIYERAEEKRQAALDRALEKAPKFVREKFEDAGIEIRKNLDKLDALKKEKAAAAAREKKAAEPRPAPQEIPLPRNLAKAASRSSSGAVRKLKAAVDREPREQLVVALSDSASDSDALSASLADADLAPHVANVFSIGDQSFLVLSLPRSDVPALKKRMKNAETVSWFEPDPCRSKEKIDDPYFNETGLWGQDFEDQWAIKRVGFSEELLTNANGQSGAPTVVAVIDTGLDWYHPDFNRDAIWRNEDEIPDNGIDDDDNGYVDDVIGWNFVGQNSRPWDHDGHGTFVAGVVAAATNNAVGIAGTNPYARIMPLKALDAFGRGHASTIAEAITYASDNGAQVINLSLGGRGLTRIEKIAVDHATKAGVLVVVAAGNNATDVAEYGPAGIDGVITVSATDRRDRRAGFSNWGEEVDISAPGVDVLSLRARKTDLLSYIRGVKYELGAGIVGAGRAYYRASGTSFAAPLVSGAASLVMSLRPDLDAEAVRRVLLNSATDIETPGIDNYTGYGLLDVKAALDADPKFGIESRIRELKVATEGGKQVLRVIGTADADEFESASISLGKGKAPDKWLTVKKRITEPVVDGVLMDIPAAVFAGSKAWTIRLITRHKNGTERESRFALTLG